MKANLLLITVLLQVNISLTCISQNLNQSNPIDCKKIFEVIMKNNQKQFDELIKNNCNVNQVDSFGMSPLHFAAGFGRFEMVKILVEKGANINFCDPWGMAAIHASCKDGFDSISVFLINKGADLNIQTKSGYYPKFSPLFAAVFFGKAGKQVVELLLIKGANPKLTNKDGKTPLDIAKEKKREVLIPILEKYNK